MSDIKEEKLLPQMENYICKIYSNNNKIGTGFFIKISRNNNLFHY